MDVEYGYEFEFTDDLSNREKNILDLITSRYHELLVAQRKVFITRQGCYNMDPTWDETKLGYKNEIIESKIELIEEIIEEIQTMLEDC